MRRSVLPAWTRAKYFHVHPSHSVKKYIQRLSISRFELRICICICRNSSSEDLLLGFCYCVSCKVCVLSIKHFYSHSGLLFSELKLSYMFNCHAVQLTTKCNSRATALTYDGNSDDFYISQYFYDSCMLQPRFSR